MAAERPPPRRAARPSWARRGVLTATEQVLLGRTGEEPGRWTGTVRVVRAGRPLLHTTVGLGPGEPAWLPPVAPRAYASTVHIGAERGDVLTGEDAVRLPLPGGWVTTAWGAELHRVVRAAAALDARATAGCRHEPRRPRPAGGPARRRARRRRAHRRTAGSPPSPASTTRRPDAVTLADDEVLLPGLVDSHVHVNEPGRTALGGLRLRHPGRRRRRRHHDRRHAPQLDPADDDGRGVARETRGGERPGRGRRRLLGRRRARATSTSCGRCSRRASSASSASCSTPACRSSRRWTTPGLRAALDRAGGRRRAADRPRRGRRRDRGRARAHRARATPASSPPARARPRRRRSAG